jgi:hypothetical protein
MTTMNQQSPRILVKHIGNMGDMVLIVPAVVAALKKKHPTSNITFITSWGYKDKKGFWGSRNQSGHSLHLIMTNPSIDQVVHWHDTKLSLDNQICNEDGVSFPTWSKDYYEKQKKSGEFDQVIELDFGIHIDDNPLERAFELAQVDKHSSTFHQIYLTDKDKEVAKFVIDDFPKPRVVLAESLHGITTRNWDTGKTAFLEESIRSKYNVEPIWFGAKTPLYQGRSLTLRENIATLTFCDVFICVLSGPAHFAAAVGLPTLTLFCDHPLHRATPAYFLNTYIKDPKKKHRTLLGPTGPVMNLLKPSEPYQCLTPAQVKKQKFNSWSKPGRQSTKSCLSVLTVDEVMLVLSDMI